MSSDSKLFKYLMAADGDDLNTHWPTVGKLNEKIDYIKKIPPTTENMYSKNNLAEFSINWSSI